METEQYLNGLRQDIVFRDNLLGRELEFHTTWGLFSPREIDAGTRLLLDKMEIRPGDHCIDLGCGYGPIGLAIAAQASQGQVTLLDKDFVAVDYSNKNAKINGLDNAKAILSNGFDQVDTSQQYDLIVSNIPAKVGKEMLSLILHDAHTLLKPGGRFYVVTINGLRQYMKRNFMDVFGNYKKLKQGSHYTVALTVKA
ncbi:MAG: class I SAM-dependent methyltransferase [bacterium]